MVGADASRPLRPTDPRELGGYTLLGRLGEGGMGSVYLARDPQDSLVAVKVIRADLAGEPEFRQRFRSEVERAKQVPPFCTAEVLDADPDHDSPYLVVEYVDGPSLSSVVQQRGPLTPANLHGLAIGVATALTAIHGAGVIHRDLKPSNVLLAPGTPKVIDFGIARAVEGQPGNTRTDQLIGTVAYMAPERLDTKARKALTPAADVFAWGAVVAFAGTGRVTFTADSMPAVAVRIMTAEPDLDGLTGPLRELVEAALSKDPADRPTARDLLDRLLTRGPDRALSSGELPRQAAAAAEAGSKFAVVDADPTSLQPGAAEPRLRDSRWAKPAAAGLGVTTLLLGGLTVALLTGALPAGFAAGSAPSASPSASASAAASPSASPSASASPSPSPSASPSPSPSPSLRPYRVDKMAKPGNWPERNDDPNGATCQYVNKSFEVTTLKDWSYQCSGPDDTLDDFRFEADVTLVDEGACAAVWFRYRNQLGYEMRVCQDKVRFMRHDVDDPGNGRSLLDTALTAPLKPLALGRSTRIAILATGSEFRLFLGGQEITQVPVVNDLFLEGRVILGVSTVGHEGVAPWRVRFKNVSMWRW
ncbi:serine/threonine-protein kinase [Catellatospora vulcania]|uniref:serine/threonine-protein kinase n=1 Tax=Catellatospora vulcania TaxID=1460450 RepID=UPI0012D385D7|nr:serine/threonine-protein kinase [Catellatospora vulcania]